MDVYIWYGASEDSVRRATGGSGTYKSSLRPCRPSRERLAPEQSSSPALSSGIARLPAQQAQRCRSDDPSGAERLRGRKDGPVTKSARSLDLDAAARLALREFVRDVGVCPRLDAHRFGVGLCAHPDRSCLGLRCYRDCLGLRSSGSDDIRSVRLGSGLDDSIAKCESPSARASLSGPI